MHPMKVYVSGFGVTAVARAKGKPKIHGLNNYTPKIEECKRLEFINRKIQLE